MKVLSTRSQPKVQAKETKGAPSIKPPSISNIFIDSLYNIFIIFCIA